MKQNNLRCLICLLVIVNLHIYKFCMAVEPTFQSIELLPPDTLAAIQIEDLQAFINHCKQTSAGKALQTKGVAETLAPLLQFPSDWAQLLRIDELKNNDMFSRLLEKLPPGGHLCLALLDIRPPMLPEKSEIDWIAIWEPRDERNDWERMTLLCAEQLFKAPEHYGLTIVRKETQAIDAKVYEWQYGDRTVPFSFAWLENRLIISNQARHISRLITIRQKDKAGIFNSQPGGEPEILRHLPSFVRTRHALAASDLSIFINIARLMTHPMSFFGKPQAKGFDWQKLVGASAIRAAGLSVHATESGFTERLFIDIPARERTGFLACLDAENLDETMLAGLSSQSTAAFAMQMDPKKMFERLRSSLQSTDARVGQSLEIALSVLLEQFHLSTELLFGFDGRVVFTLCGDPHAGSSQFLPGTTVKLGLKNSAAMIQALVSFKLNMKEHLEFIETIVDKNTIVTVRPKHSEFGATVFQLSYLIKDNFLLIAPYPLALKNELYRIATVSNQAGLSQEKSFLDMRKNLPDKVQALSLLNTAQLFDAAQVIGLPYIQTFGGDYAKAAANWPDRELSAMKFQPALFGLKIAEEGLIIDSAGPAPLLAIGALASTAHSLELLQKIRKYFLPSREQIKFLQIALEAYDKEHPGKYPEKMEELAPKFIPLIPTSFYFLKYLGKQEDINAVVAYEKVPADGLITLLLQDGRLVKCKFAELNTVLKTGCPLERPKNARVKATEKH